MREEVLLNSKNLAKFKAKVCHNCKYEEEHRGNKCDIYFDLWYYGISEHVTAVPEDKETVCDFKKVRE